ncbi:MAG: hypothetical protein CMM48_13250 [Rhodospirillaceae bacterium]|nr:hypothetical protein [Rhodospirillaceae bacterium]
MSERAPIAHETHGSGPDLVLFHGGFGCRKHWARNIEPLAEHFTVHALDHPGYGESARVSREMTGSEYLDNFHSHLMDMFPGNEPLKFAGFSFGGAISTNMAARLGDRVSHLLLISPAGGRLRNYAGRPTRSYKEAEGDEQVLREICRHNLLINMLSYPETVTEECLDIQVYCVHNTKFNSRKVSGGETLAPDLGRITCKLRVLWGEGDDSKYRKADDLIGDIRDAYPGELDLYRVPQAGHWSAFENADEVNSQMIEFFTTP